MQGLLVEASDLGAFLVELGAVGDGVGENGDEPTWAGEEALDSPAGKGEGLAGLAAPHPDFEAVGVVGERFFLVMAEVEFHGSLSVEGRELRVH